MTGTVTLNAFALWCWSSDIHNINILFLKITLEQTETWWFLIMWIVCLVNSSIYTYNISPSILLYWRLKSIEVDGNS